MSVPSQGVPKPSIHPYATGNVIVIRGSETGTNNSKNYFGKKSYLVFLYFFHTFSHLNI